LIYLLGLAFFGLTQEYRLQLFTQVHEIVFYGKGGYTWFDVYNLPISTRRFIYNKIVEAYEEKNGNNNGQNAVEQGKQMAELLRNENTVKKPTYQTKVSQK